MATPNYVIPSTIHDPIANTNTPLAAWGDQINSNMEFLRMFKGANIARSGAQPCPNGVWTIQLWNTLGYDSDGYANLANHYFTIPAGRSGMYMCWGYYFFETKANNLEEGIAMRFMRDHAGTLTEFRVETRPSPFSGIAPEASGVRFVDMVAGDRIRLDIWQANLTTPAATRNCTSAQMGIGLIGSLPGQGP